MNKIVSTVIASVAIVALVPATAFAWTYQLKGKGVCQPSGSFQVTWTITNPENQVFTVKQSSAPTAVSVGATVAANGSKTFTQGFDGTKTGNHTLTLSGNWPGDQRLLQMTKTVNQTAVCAQPQQGGQGGGTPVPPVVTPTPATPAVESASVVAPAVVPVGAVDAGNGGATTTVNLAAIAALIASAVAVGLGVIRRVQKR